MAILTPKEYSEQFTLNKKRVSAKTIIRRCEEKQLPSNHKPLRLTSGRWLIIVRNGTKSK